jgi:Tol biopolymer transport system component
MTMSQLWIVPVDVEKNSLSAPRALTDTTRHVVYADLVTALDWSPDGSHIAFVHRPEQEGWELNDIATVDVRTGVITPLAQSAAAEITPFYSPDGRWIAYAVEAEGTFAFDILLTPVSGGPTRSLATTPGRWPTLIGWNPDSRSIYFIEEYGGFTRVCLLTTDGARHREIFQWDRTMNHVAMNASRTMIGFTAPAEYGRFFEAHAARLDRFRALSIRPRFRNLTRFRDNDR